MPITNLKNLPLELAVWVAYNDYDFTPATNTISATGIMKPLRQIILPPRLSGDGKVTLDVENLIASALGTAIHAAIQRAWENGNHAKALRELGFGEETIKRILINPSLEQIVTTKDPVPVYIEQRASRTIVVNGLTITVSGKFDMVCAGKVTDTKSTTVYSWIMGNKDDDYRLQMSIYRWLNPEKVTQDVGRINFVFTDWSKLDARRRKNQNYPQNRMESRELKLLSLAETEAWIREKLTLILRHQMDAEPDLPECTEEELWITPPEKPFKYYANPATIDKGGRSSKNFETRGEADQYLAEKGKGVVVEVKGDPKRCSYCPAFNICTQKDKYDHD